jgi:hypothetical protein
MGTTSLKVAAAVVVAFVLAAGVVAALNYQQILNPSNSALAQDEFDCASFNSQAEAQAELKRDPSGLDGPIEEASDGTAGVACEVYPYEDPARDETPAEVVSGSASATSSASGSSSASASIPPDKTIPIPPPTSNPPTKTPPASSPSTKKTPPRKSPARNPTCGGQPERSRSARGRPERGYHARRVKAPKKAEGHRNMQPLRVALSQRRLPCAAGEFSAYLSGFPGGRRGRESHTQSTVY